MSFPWAHRIDPVVRNIPRDIDEMPGILLIDDAEHQACSLKNGNFDLPKQETGYEDSDDDDDGDDCIRAVARRADNPGVIQLLTCAPSLRSHERAALPDAIRTGCKPSALLRDPLIEPATGSGIGKRKPTSGTQKVSSCDHSFLAFEHMQAEKRTKLENGLARLKTLFVSVRVCSTSSRPVLFSKADDQKKVPLLLPAVYPQDFRLMTKSKNPSRSPPGRTQMIWMEKTPSQTSHRVNYKSFLTSEKVESGIAKRPREVSVGIRINGELLCSNSISFDEIKQETPPTTASSKRKRNDGKPDRKPTTLYSTKVINDALDDVCHTDVGMSTRQCTLEPEEFTKRALCRELSKDKSIGWNTKVTIKSLNLVYIAPRIDCFPSEDALFRVVCTAPGELPPTNVEEVLNQAAKNKPSPVCSVCWRVTSITGEPVSECSDCGVLVHLQSCQSPSDFETGKQKCASCSVGTTLFKGPDGRQESHASGTTSSNERVARRSTRLPSSSSSGSPKDTQKPLSCALCPHIGGAMSIISREKRTLWVHDICRVWCDISTEIPSLEDDGKGRKAKKSLAPVVLADVICALCGASNQGDSDKNDGIVRCAASGCSIYFHPMCALFLSKCDEIGNKSPPCGAESECNYEDANSKDAPKEKRDRRLEQLLEDDKLLCRQYSLRFAKCKIPGIRRIGRACTKTSPPTAVVLPVCFCGIHNPKRDRSLYGLYPGGKLIDGQVMRVPPRKKGGDY
jgi:PHD-zinc-finger like domain